MANKAPPLHRICTFDEAKALLAAHRQFWVTECQCREGSGKCKRSRHDVCTYFVPEYPGATLRKVTRAFVDGILKEARDKQLVARPFRDDEDFAKTAGCCFCCDDCCGYFQDGNEECDKGRLVEKTVLADCTHCGACVDVCHFHAKTMHGDKLKVDRKKCYGCGLCVDACPTECISMVERS
jgi:ferredoxin